MDTEVCAPLPVGVNSHHKFQELSHFSQQNGCHQAGVLLPLKSGMDTGHTSEM